MPPVAPPGPEVAARAAAPPEAGAAHPRSTRGRGGVDRARLARVFVDLVPLRCSGETGTAAGVWRRLAGTVRRSDTGNTVDAGREVIRVGGNWRVGRVQDVLSGK